MSTRMLIDARHDEETRVAIVKGSRVEDFDYESASKRQLKGNIYLARITRVEPSLQAAFVEYGGNRHGFLAFSEIHPDYYQIPAEDREALIKGEQAEELAEAEAILNAEEKTAPADKKAKKPRRTRRTKKDKESEDSKAEAAKDAPSGEDNANEAKADEAKADDAKADETKADVDEAKPVKKKRTRRAKPKAKATDGDTAPETKDDKEADNGDDKDTPKSIAAAIEEDVATKELSDDQGAKEKDDSKSDADDVESDENDESEHAEEIEAAERRRNMRALKRRYKIQEVIKRRQVVLIQVVKEERGNKGAALTTYISLAGRYCVLMPNSTHSGGISRKISNVSDRKRLKTMMSSLNLPDGMGCIVRTAGMARTKNEVKRDLDYLLRLWNGIRDLTLKSVAPSNIYEEGNLIKRSIRDLYNKDIEEILVEGNDGFKTAKDFISMLMPTHSNKVKHYQDSTIPLFNRYQVEAQLEAMYNPNVQLKSGGYIVINPTEALISVDVNSGRATKEKNIEETAVKTNLEAAEELGRQLRLRDMAGLIVIDFIDMEDRGNNRAVERRLKDVLKSDRARIQVGRISSFGLMEMSRQRMRPNLLEASMMVCTHCDGAGVVRNVESAALQALRALEEEGIRGRSAHLTVTLNREVGRYMLNKKRADIYALEIRYNLSIEILGNRDMGPSDLEIERENIDLTEKPAITADAILTQSNIMDSSTESDKIDKSDEATSDETADEDKQPRTRGRRRRRRRGRDRSDDATISNETSDKDTSSEKPVPESSPADESEEKPKSRRRRGRRGGRRRKPNENQENVSDSEANTDTSGDSSIPSNEESIVKSDDSTPAVVADKGDDKGESKGQPDEKPSEDKPKRRPRRSKKVEEKAKSDDQATEDASAQSKDASIESSAKAAEPQSEEKPKRARRSRKKVSDEDTSAPTEAAPSKSVKTPDDEPVKEKPKRGRPRKTAPKPEESKEAPASAPKTSTKEEPKAPVKEEAKADVKDSPKEAEKPTAPPRKGWWNKTFG